MIKLVEATEGGALIHGSKVMTLKNAIKKYCKSSFNVKWHIDHTKKIFEGDQKEFALEYFKNASEKLKEIQNKAKEALNYYEKIEMSVKKYTISNTDLKIYLNKIGELNDYMEHDYMAETVMDGLLGVEYTLRPEIYREHDNEMKEIQDIVEQGKVMFYGIALGAGELMDIVNKTIVPYAERCAQKGVN